MKKRHRTIGIGGTFDHLHQGHQHFIDFAADQAEKVIIGITNDKLVKEKRFPELLESYSKRARAVNKYCTEQGYRFDIVKLSDPYGPAIERPTPLQALAVTTETLKGADKINEIREASQTYPLPVYVADLIKDERGQDIHSDRIRAGEISREGTVYASHLQQDLVLDEAQKQVLRQPLGQIVDEPSPSYMKTSTWLVGDATLDTFLQNQWAFDHAVYDLHQQRQAFTSHYVQDLEPDLKTLNQAGTISREMVTSLQQLAASHQTYLQVDGEEDLAIAALILLSPLETRLYYGQPHEGLVEVTVTEQLKHKVATLLF